MIARGTMIGHYRVLDRIGAGGMGVVYSAEDTRLGRRVALKFLSVDLSDDPVARARFVQEARVASSLDHENICTIHEVADTEDGQTFIAMGYYTGTTLRGVLSGTPLDPDRARDIAVQVAYGLDHAHRRGIVHRDIKPSNLLITEDGVVKILDFGVAKRGDLHSSKAAVTPGTLAYMSPEQMVGDGVDARTDVWSFGVVLYEMLTGRRPFEASQAPALMHRILDEDPPVLKSAGGRVPSDLREVVERCLEKDPSKRYASGSELLHHLAPGMGEAADRRRRIRRLGAGLVVAVLLGVLALLTPPGRRALQGVLGGASAMPEYIAVLPFSSADTATAVLAGGLTQAFTELVSDLASADPSLWVLPFSDMVDTEASTPSELYRMYPVDLVVTGALRRSGEDVVLSVDLFDLTQGEPRVVASLDIPDPQGSLSRSSAYTLFGGALGLPPPPSARGDGEFTSTPSPAQRYHVLGVGQLQRVYDEGSIEAAITLFETALTEDSSYSPAYAGLCEAHWEGYLESGDIAHADEARRMCDRAVELSREEPQALVALGRTQYFTGELQRAERTLREGLIRGAGADAHRWLGQVLEDLGRLEEAEREYRRAIALRGDIWTYYSALAMMYMNADRHEEAIELHREVIRLSPQNYIGYSNLGASLMLTNRPDEAEEQFRRSLEMRPTPLAYRNLGYLALLQGQYAEAVSVLRRGLSLSTEDWWTWRWLAHAHHWLGDDAEARTAWERVVALTESRLAFNESSQDMLCGIAEALVALGERDSGRNYLSFLASFDLRRTYNVYWIGRVYEMLGNRRTALRYVNQALESGFDENTVAADPWLTDLREDPDYKGPR